MFKEDSKGLDFILKLFHQTSSSIGLLTSSFDGTILCKNLPISRYSILSEASFPVQPPIQ